MSTQAELTFRIATGIAIGAWLVIRFIFQKKFGSGEKTLKLHAGRERLSYLLVGLSMLPAKFYVLGGLFTFAGIALPEPMRWLGTLFSILGCALFAYTHMTLGRNWSGVLEIAREHTLVTHGPYRFIRHPMYTAFFLMGAGILLLSANWLVGGLVIAAVAYMYIVRVEDEERMMLAQFGEEYAVYMEKSGRLLPRVGVMFPRLSVG